MAFVAEDGTGLDNANSYVSLAYANEYHVDRGNASWALATEAARQAALVRATDFIDKRFGRRFRGWRKSKAQSLEWPRMGAVDQDRYLLHYVPSQIQKACAEYALRALTNTPLAPDNSAVGLKANREKIGPIETETRVDSTNRKSMLVDATSIPDYPEADLWMSELLRSSISGDISRA